MRASGPPWPTIAPLLCALAALCVTLLVAPPFAVGTCVDPAPLRHGSQINVAVLVWIADEPEGLFRGNLTDTRATKLPFGNSLVQPWMMAVDMYVKRMRGRPLPLPDGQSVTLNFVYINLANTKIPPGIKFDVAPDFDHTAGQCQWDRRSCASGAHRRSRLWAHAQPRQSPADPGLFTARRAGISRFDRCLFVMLLSWLLLLLLQGTTHACGTAFRSSLER